MREVTLKYLIIAVFWIAALVLFILAGFNVVPDDKDVQFLLLGLTGFMAGKIVEVFMRE